MVSHYLIEFSVFTLLLILPLLLKEMTFFVLVEEVSSMELHEFVIQSSTLLLLHDLHELRRFLQIKLIQFFLFVAVMLLCLRASSPLETMLVYK